MPRHLRRCLIAGSLVALGLGAAACGSSGSSDAASTGDSKTTTTIPVTTTLVTTTRATTTEATAPADDGTMTDGGDTTTTERPADSGTGAVDCQALLRRYAEVFDPEDLAAVVTFFREYEPSMPDDVAAATERLAAAYQRAGDLGHIDIADSDLTADAVTFSDWTNDGCPTR